MNEKQAKRLRRMIRETNRPMTKAVFQRKYKAEKRILKDEGLVILLVDTTQRQGPLFLMRRTQLNNWRGYV